MRYVQLPEYFPIRALIRDIESNTAAEILSFAQKVIENIPSARFIYEPRYDSIPRISLGYSCIWFDWLDVQLGPAEVFFVVGLEDGGNEKIFVTTCIYRAVAKASEVNSEGESNIVRLSKWEELEVNLRH